MDSKNQNDEFFLQMKSFSLNSFPKNKKENICPENLFRSLSFLPKNFVPKPKPQKAIVSPSPMILSCKPKFLSNKNTLLYHRKSKQNHAISCEEYSSSCDSDDIAKDADTSLDNNEEDKKCSIINNDNTKFDFFKNFTLSRKMLSKIRLQYGGRYCKDDVNVYKRSPLEHFTNDKENITRFSIDFGTKLESKGISILNILELTSKEIEC